MKKLLLAIATIVFLISCDKNKPKNNLELAVTIKGLKKGTLYIKKVNDTSLVTLDTIKIDGESHFVVNLKVDSPEMFYLVLDRGVTVTKDNSLSFFAESGKMNIESSLDFFSSEAKITGSNNQKLYDEYRKIATQFVDQNMDLIQLKIKAFQNKNSLEISKIEENQNAILKRKYLYTTNFAVNNAGFEVAPYIALAEISDINLKYLDTIKKCMSPKIAKSLYGKKLIDLIAQRKKIE